MDGWLHFQIKKDELEAEAGRARLLQAAAKSQQPAISKPRSLLAAVGRRLTRWGNRLQALEHRPRPQLEQEPSI